MIRQPLVQITGEVARDRFRKRGGITRPADKAGTPLDDVVLQGGDIRSDDGKSKVVAQEQDPTLEYMRVRQCQHVCRLEIQFGFVVRYMLDALDNARTKL